MYIGEALNSKTLAGLTKALLVVGALFALTIGALGISAFMEHAKVGSMKQEIATKQKAIVEAQEAAKTTANEPKHEAVPKGLNAVNAFQGRLNKLAKDNGASITQFNGSDQMNPFVSTFSSGAQAGSSWVQVDVKFNLQGTAKTVLDSLSNLDKIGIPYEFTSLEISRLTVSATGQATISANVSVRVLTIPGGS
jgi:hypothetical protein